MRVFLIHGLGRTPISMSLLARRLEAAGHETKLFGYWVTQHELDEIAARFASTIASTLADDAVAGTVASATEGTASGPVPYAVIGHSLGNIVTRQATPMLPAGFSRFIMLAPPNRPPAVARTLKDNPLFRLSSRGAGQKLARSDFYDDLPIPDVPSVVIAGNAGPIWSRFSPWKEANDIIVRVDETRLEGVPLIEIPAVHTFLMNRRDVTRACLDFLERGAV